MTDRGPETTEDGTTIPYGQVRARFDTLCKVDLITYQGERTDLFGHSYFTTNPQVSSDLIAMLRYGKQLGEPGRQLVRTGKVSWKFPPSSGERD